MTGVKKDEKRRFMDRGLHCRRGRGFGNVGGCVKGEQDVDFSEGCE